MLILFTLTGCKQEINIDTIIKKKEIIESKMSIVNSHFY